MEEGGHRLNGFRKVFFKRSKEDIERKNVFRTLCNVVSKRRKEDIER